MSQSNKNLIVGIVIGLVVLVGLVWVARPKPGGEARINSSGQKFMYAEEISHDFGNISMSQGKVRYNFKIKNKSSANTTLEKIYTSCMCTNASLKIADVVRGPFGMPGHGLVPTIKEVLGSEKEADLEVEFDPAAHGPAGVGTINRSVFVESAEGEVLEFKIAAVVTP